MSQGSANGIFGKRTTQHTIIIASGEKVRHFTVRPWMAAAGLSVVGALSIGYLLATSYLVFRDDLLGASMARQASLQHAYEDRIAALRAQVDRLTSRQVLDQQVMQTQIDTLLKRQMALTSRHGKLGPLLERAEANGLLSANMPLAAPVPTARPTKEDRVAAGSERAAGSASTAAASPLEAIDTITGTTASRTVAADAAATSLANGYMPVTNPSGPADPLETLDLRTTPVDNLRGPRGASADPQTLGALKGVHSGMPDLDGTERLVGELSQSLHHIEREQFERLRNLTVNAVATAGAITSVLAKSGIAPGVAPAETLADTAMGGPYVRIDNPAAFDASLERLDKALDQLESVRKQALSLPFGQPLENEVVTSGFGGRPDPFLERLAFHAGVDLRSPIGTDVRATGAGKVVSAGPASGYGNMVEIDHGNGITTRYGHLSQVLVAVGDTVAAGSVIAKSGNTGRSTGPHLHYEVRLKGDAVDPMRFLNAGMKLQPLLNG